MADDLAQDSAWQTIAAERLALADLLEGLSAEQWAAPSLCAAWTVRHVAAHLMVGPDGSLRDFLVAWVRSGLSFDRTNRRLVQTAAAAPTADIVADLRSHAADRFTPPTFDWHAPLSDLRLHALDICVPLGLDPGQPVEPWSDVLDLLVSAKARRGFVARGRPDLTLVATDLGWSQGTGAQVEGPAHALALAVSGRPALLDRLEGPGLPALRAWSGRMGPQLKRG